MATAHREQIAKQLLQAHVSTSEVDGRVLVQRKPPGNKPQGRSHGAGAAAGGGEGGRPARRGQPHQQKHAHHPHRLLPTPTTAELEQRELGWNDRFIRDSPSQPKRPQRMLTHRSTAAEDTAHAQDVKEKKIRDERQQYGHGGTSTTTTTTTTGAMNKPQRPGASRLLPIGSLPLPPREPEAASSKQEKLRFKVLQAIDLRETLLYQLNALILCTPVQESLVMAASRVVVHPMDGTHGGGGGVSTKQLKPRATMALAATTSGTSGAAAPVMSSAREATRLAQQLASDLQIAGIQAVEGMVEWMLEAGAKADKPPEFLWRGRNYFLKMESDLDFAGPELRVRGVVLDCFSVANPLCVRPDQRLGRVLAAQSIIHEMVTMARQQQLEQEQDLEQKTDDKTPRGDARKASGRKAKSSRTPRRQETTTTDDVRISPRASSFAVVSPTKIKAVPSQQSADEMILLSTTRDNDGGDDGEDEYGDQDDALTSARSVEQVGLERSEVEGSNQDVEDEKEELMDLLDESFSGDLVMADTLPVPVPTPPQSSSAKSSARDEYENSFDADTAEEHHHETTPDAPHVTPGEPEERSPTKEPAIETADDEVVEADNQLEETRPAATVATVATDATPTKADGEAQEWEHVAQLLLTIDCRGSSNSGDGVSGSELQQRAAWAMDEENRRKFQSALERDPLHVADALVDSLLQLLLDSPSRRNKIADVCDDRASTRVQLRQQLLEQCQVVVSEVISKITTALHHELQQLSPLVSEVDFTDVLDAAAKVFRDHTAEKGALPYLTQAMEIMRALYYYSSSDVPSTISDSVGLSQLIHVFYPYLTNQRRDRLVRNWDQLTKLLHDHIRIDVDAMAFVLDATCRVLLLNVASLRRNSDRDEIPKLTLVCDRANVLDSSVAAAHRKCLFSQELLLPQYHLYPFFMSSFGEKRVDGVQVEEGEGKGPLKEWFTLVASELTAKWRAVALPPSALYANHANSTDEFDPVLVNGNKLVVDRLEAVLLPGYRVEWQSRSDDTTVSRILNKCDPATGTYLLDRGGLSNQSFPVSELCVFQPRIAILEYMQASESYWLNESLVDTPLNRHTIAFVGWLFANALVHQCALQLRVHRLLFELLLRTDDDSERISITLQDLQSLDPSLWTALQQMKLMKPAEFASYLEFEGVAGAASMSVDGYISQTIQEKYGAASSVAWQLQELRSGFRRVFTTDDLKLARLTADDLVDQLSGSKSGSATEKDQVDLEQVFRVSLDPDFASCSPLRRSFWTAVNGFDEKLKRQLVKFITGVDTLPQPSTEFLRIEMPFPAVSPSDLTKTLRMLPQSHTCDNTLELPHYWRALCWKAQHDPAQPSAVIEAELVELLSQKLRLAAEYSSGYGLDGTAATTASLSSMLPGNHRTNDDQLQLLSAQESYDSLDLPALGDGSMASGRGSKSPVEMGRREDDDADAVAEAEEEQKKEEEETQIGVGSSPLACPEMAEKEKEEEAYGAEDWEEEELAD